MEVDLVRIDMSDKRVITFSESPVLSLLLPRKGP